MRLVRGCVAAACIASLLAGCSGGGGGGTAVPKVQSTGQPSGGGRGTVAITLKVPISGRPLGKARRPQYVPPTVQSFTVSLNSVPVTSVTQNVASCALSAANADVAGLTNENGIAVLPFDGSIYVTGNDPNPTNNTLAIQRDQTQVIFSNSFTPAANTLGGDYYGNMWNGDQVDLNQVPFSYNQGGGVLNGFSIGNSSPNPYSGQVAEGNDGNLYFAELSGILTPVGSLGQITGVTFGNCCATYNTDVAVAGKPGNLIGSTDKMLWYTDTSNGKIAQYNATTTANPEFSAPGGLTVLPLITPSLTNTDVFALAKNGGGVLSLIDFTEAGTGTVMQVLPAAYTPANVTGIVQGADFALWISQNGGASGNVVRLSQGNPPFPYSPQTATVHISGVATGGDGKVYYLENDANKVGELTLSNTCTTNVGVTAGSYTMTAKTFDAPNGGGNQLGIVSGPVTIVSNQANNFNFTLNGVLSHILVVPQLTNFSGGCPLPDPITIQGLDADGNIILPPGNFVDANNNPITVTVTSSQGLTVTPPSVTQTGVVSITYPVAFYTDTVTATASGGPAPPGTASIQDGCGG